MSQQLPALKQCEIGDATVLGLSCDEMEESTTDQIAYMAASNAFNGDIKIMPDCHVGSGAVIGFTMELPQADDHESLRVCPNTVGVDIGCFAGETEVKLLDGNDYRIDKLAEREEPFHVYSAQPDGTVEIGEATARKTRTDAELVAVTLDNGETIRCTPDHEYMLRDGSYRQAQELSPGDSLMPLYTGETDDGYQLVFHNTGGQIGDRSVREHWLVARSNAMDIPSDVSDPVVHHKNYDKKDNRPANLEIMPRDEHSSMHREQGGGDHWQSESFEQKRIEALRNREQTQAEIETATDNITSYMENNPDEFALVAKQNGERGAETLREFNTSERECNICGYVADNPAAEYWHQVREHPEETDYELSSNAESAIENHKVVSVERLDVTEDVYCLNVPQYHNFALSAGVFVHNCGMLAARLDMRNDDVSELVSTDAWLATLESDIQRAVPLGFSVHDDPSYHLVDEFPWAACREQWSRLKTRFGLDDPEWFDGYGADYFDALTQRVEYDPQRAINSVGTLGGGNHFIEVAYQGQETLGGAYTGECWLVIHSGSRGIGLNIAQYWQQQATRTRENEWIRHHIDGELERYIVPDIDDDELAEWFLGGKGQSYIDSDAIREAVNDNYLVGYLHDRIRDAHPNKRHSDEDLDYLEGQAVAGYLVDMVFAQSYAEVNRRQMLEQIQDEAGLDVATVIQSPHNYIDPVDGILRKGATAARRGEPFVVPFNMADGSVICTTRYDAEDWNYSAPHGAGRRMSRTQAFDELSLDEYEALMDDVYTTSVSDDTLDEAPPAYKNSEAIQQAIEHVATVDRVLDPVINIKAED